MLLLTPLLLVAAARSLPPPTPKALTLAVVDTVKVGGDGGWDYVAIDGPSRRIFVPRSTHTLVLDLDGRVLGDIPDTQGVHGVALAPRLDRGFTSNGRANTMTVFKLSTLEVEKVVKTTGENPDSILFDPATSRVFTFNGRGHNVTAFDASSLEVLGTIPVGGKPEFCATDGKGKIFANIEDTSELIVLDPGALRITARWPLKPLEEPSGLALDAQNGRLFCVGSNRLMAVVDAATGRILQSLPIGDGCDGVAFDPGTGLAYASNGEGTLTVIERSAKGPYRVAATIPTRKGARTLAVDPASHRVFLPTAEFAPAPRDRPGQRVRPSMVPGSFQLVIVGTK